MTSKYLHFTMKKDLLMIIFGHNFFICQPIFKIFVALYMTLRGKRMIRSHFARGVSEQGDIQKGSFQRMV